MKKGIWVGGRTAFSRWHWHKKTANGYYAETSRCGMFKASDEAIDFEVHNPTQNRIGGHCDRCQKLWEADKKREEEHQKELEKLRLKKTTTNNGFECHARKGENAND
jgi:hypothetical protein